MFGILTYITKSLGLFETSSLDPPAYALRFGNLTYTLGTAFQNYASYLIGTFLTLNHAASELTLPYAFCSPEEVSSQPSPPPHRSWTSIRMLHMKHPCFKCYRRCCGRMKERKIDSDWLNEKRGRMLSEPDRKPRRLSEVVTNGWGVVIDEIEGKYISLFARIPPASMPSTLSVHYTTANILYKIQERRSHQKNHPHLTGEALIDRFFSTDKDSELAGR